MTEHATREVAERYQSALPGHVGLVQLQHTEQQVNLDQRHRLHNLEWRDVNCDKRLVELHFLACFLFYQNK